MPTFQYFGQTVTIDTLYSYARVSSDVQTVEKGGEGIPRQLELHREFADQYNIATDDLTGLQFVDEGLSGSKGDHLKDGGGLAAFMKLAKAGKLKANPGLTVESFSRLSRLPIDLAMRLFLDVINAGVTLITLVDRTAYTQASVRANAAQIYQVSSAMQAARAQADSTGYYSTNSWRVRRGTPTALAPSWFDKFVNGNPVSHFKGNAPKGAVLELRINPDKHKIIQRIFTDILTIGVGRLAVALNAEGVPLFSGGDGGWNQSSISVLIRGRMVLGEQQIGKMIDGVRRFNGEYVKAYPAVVTEDQWLLANAAIDERKRTGEGVEKGVVNGRNATKMANIFGELARCDVCNGRMKIKQKGRRKQFKYFGCANTGTKKLVISDDDGNKQPCPARKFHRYEWVETRLLNWFNGNPSLLLQDWTPAPVEDKAATLRAQIATAQAAAAAIFQKYEQALTRSGAMAESMQLKLETDHAAKLDEIKLLERQLTAALVVKPVDEQIATVTRLAARLDGLEGDERVSARAQIANALPVIFKDGLRFKPDGSFAAHMQHRVIPFPAKFDLDELNPPMADVEYDPDLDPPSEAPDYGHRPIRADGYTD